METRNDVLKSLNEVGNACCPILDDYKNLIRVKGILTNLFQDDNSEKMESMLGNVEEVDILYRVGDLRKIPDVVKILRKDNKNLQIQCNI